MLKFFSWSFGIWGQFYECVYKKLDRFIGYQPVDQFQMSSPFSTSVYPKKCLFNHSGSVRILLVVGTLICAHEVDSGLI